MVLDLLQGQQSFKEHTIRIVYQKIAQSIEVLRIIFVELHKSLTVGVILPNVFHQVRSRMPVLELAVIIDFLRVNVHDKESVHQVFLQCIIHKEYIFIQPILLFVVLADVLLRSQVQQECHQIDTHVRISNAAVEDYRHGSY